MKPETSNLKSEIIASRSVGLGSSDAKMVAKIGKIKTLSDPDRQRLAIMVGKDEKRQFSTKATEFGNQIETHIYSIVLQKYPKAKSNPFYKSEKLSEQYGFAVFNHIDFEVETDQKLIWIECKATIKSYTQTLEDYREQISWHYMLLQEKAEKLNKKPVLMLAHYRVTDYESFNADNLTINEIERAFLPSIDFSGGLEILSETIKNGFDYQKQEELYAENLPAPVQEQMQKTQNYYRTIKHAEEQIAKFKERMLPIMQEQGIKAIKSDFLNLTYVAPTTTAVFDRQAFEKDHPDLFQKYIKTQNRKSYIILKYI